MAKIIGATNEYYISEKFNTPARRLTMVAKKGWLSSTWNLYTVRERPMMPLQNGRNIHPPIKKKIASGLNLSEVFERMRQHEEKPASHKFREMGGVSVDVSGSGSITHVEDKKGPSSFEEQKKSSAWQYLMWMGMREDGQAVFKQKKPEHDPHYWRNVKNKMGARRYER